MKPCEHSRSKSAGIKRVLSHTKIAVAMRMIWGDGREEGEEGGGGNVTSFPFANSGLARGKFSRMPGLRQLADSCRSMRHSSRQEIPTRWPAGLRSYGQGPQRVFGELNDGKENHLHHS